MGKSIDKKVKDATTRTRLHKDDLDLAIRLGKAKDWSEMDKVATVSAQESVVEFKIYLVAKLGVNPRSVPDHAIRSGYPLVRQGTKGELMHEKSFYHSFGTDPVECDEIYRTVYDAVAASEDFESEGGIFHPIKAIKKALRRRKGQVPPAPEGVYAGIERRVEDLESAQALLASAANDHGLNQYIAEALSRPDDIPEQISS